MEDLPPSKVTYKMEGGKAKEVEANPLTKVPGNTKGQASNSKLADLKGRDLIDGINQSIINEDGKLSKPWVQFHLLNKSFHGPLTVWNIVPARRHLNNSYRTIESEVDDLLEEYKEIYVKVEVEYHESKKYDLNKPEIQIIIEKFPNLKATFENADKGDYPSSIKISYGKSKDKLVVNNIPITDNKLLYEPPSPLENDPTQRFRNLLEDVKEYTSKNPEITQGELFHAKHISERHKYLSEKQKLQLGSYAKPITAKEYIIKYYEKYFKPNIKVKTVWKEVEQKYALTLTHNNFYTAVRELEQIGIFKTEVKGREKIIKSYNLWD